MYFFQQNGIKLLLIAVECLDAKTFRGFRKDLMSLEMKNLKRRLWLRKCFVSHACYIFTKYSGKA